MSWPKFRQAPAAALHDAVWAAALRLGAFSYQDLASAVAIPVDRATGFVQHWVRIGAVEFVGTAPTGAQDGAKLREESQMICESGQVLWFRAAVGRASVYRGEFK